LLCIKFIDASGKVMRHSLFENLKTAVGTQKKPFVLSEAEA